MIKLENIDIYVYYLATYGLKPNNKSKYAEIMNALKPLITT